MFPWVLGFEWTTANVIFLGAFFSVIAVVAVTVTTAVLRSWKSFRDGSMHEIRWEADFEDLPVEARACRHELAGEVAHRTCERGFECGSCAKHRDFVAKREPSVWAAPVTECEPVAGMAIDPSLFYHRGHAWAKPVSDGNFEIGLDALGQKIVGANATAVLPALGSSVEANGTGWMFRRGSSSVRILSPVKGTVVAHGGKDEGWYLRVKPEHPTCEHLLHGREVRPWFTREVERLEFLLRQDGVGASLADGGELVDDPIAQSARGDWESLAGEMLLEP